MSDVGHPAKFSPAVIAAINDILGADCGFVRAPLILDPFAGVGSSNIIGFTVGNELEMEWARQNKRGVVGNALQLPYLSESFEAIVTSPVYGNRMSDHHNAKDDSERITYKHKLGRDLHPDNSGAMHWGRQYKEFHLKAWVEALRCLKPGGAFILNVSNHLKLKIEQPVVEWHVETLLNLGLHLGSCRAVKTSRMRKGANGQQRVDSEKVIHLVKYSPGAVVQHLE